MYLQTKSTRFNSYGDALKEAKKHPGYGKDDVPVRARVRKREGGFFDLVEYTKQEKPKAKKKKEENNGQSAPQH